MKNIFGVLPKLGILALLCSQIAESRAAADDIVLFDAAETPAAAVASQNQGVFALKDGLLQIETKGGTGYPGILIKGSWDLSQCNRLTLELVNRDKKGELPLTVRLDNPDANPGKSHGVFIDRVKISGKGAKAYEVALPPWLPNMREINAKLDGMKRGPLATLGVAADLDASKVVGVAVYINDPKLDWRWGVKRIVARKGPLPEIPDWMRLPAEKFFPFIDVYGQFKYKDWPGKTHSDADLKQALDKEQVDLAAHPGPEGWDKFGGWAAGPKLKATGHFRVEKVDGKWWLVDPEGRLYWSHGPVRVTSSSAVTPLDNREFYFTDLPKEDSPLALFFTTHDALLWPYYEARGIKRTYDFSSANAFRKYGADWAAQYADMAHRRLRSWGMNTIANSSDIRICQQARTPYCDRFELKSPDIAGSTLGWWKFKDPFHPDFRANFHKLLLARKAELDDPWCIGFFVDNEITWGGPTDLAVWTLQSPASQPAKIEMVARLKAKYGEIAKLNAAWASSFAGWDALLASQEKVPKGALEDCREFTIVLTEEYFKRIREEFKAVAPDTLYLGCRFAGSTEAAVRMGAKYCDVISYNIYRHTLDTFKLPEGVDRPILVGEFHFGALDRGLFHASVIGVPNQEARGKAYEEYVTSALRHPNFVGVHWHQFGDQPTTGRFDGENFQNGFVDVCDTPYWETINASRRVGYAMYSIRSQKNTATSSGEMQRLANDRICFALSADGRKFELGYAGEAATLSGGRGLFDMMVGRGQRHEWGIDPEAQSAVVTKEGAALVAHYAKLRHDGAEYDVSVELRFTLDGDGVVCEAQLQNNSELAIEEFWFPWVGPFRGLAADPARDTLILPEGFGRRVQNPGAYVARFHTGYMAPDQKRILACSHYPGGWMTMNWFGFYGGGKSLGLLSLDDTFQTTGLNVARDTPTEMLSAGFVRYPFLKRGTWRSPRSLVRLHHNDWHDDARTYRRWADTSWWSQSPRPQWVDQMHGWQRIIMKHQYGEIFYRYRDLVDVFEAGRPYGIKTLFVFGWFRGGMDNGYPDYQADEELGGEAELRKAIAEVQKRGGRVILYANGHLIDVDSDYYQQVGKRICLRTSQGSEYREAYKFSGDGTFLRNFGARSFVAACQSTPEWREKLIEIGGYMASFGADGIFFDQMGGHVPYLCFDPSHPHVGPALAQGPGKNVNLAAIRKALIDGHPDRTFGTELASDCLNRHVDFVHTSTFGMSPNPEAMPEMFHYTFPEILFSCREIRDESDHVRRMNWAFLYGRRFDVEIWRCRGDLRSAPAYGAYMAKLIALRDRWPDLLMTGRFVDEDFFQYDHQAFTAKGYTAGNRAAVIVWNHTSKPQRVTLKLPSGRRFVEGATAAGNAFQPGDMLPAQSVAVLVYE